uniref:Uncharacterized protein n=1 Tax=Quercus lobata TaxID=97700 RepID=A0A7N2MFI7_QUELO
MENGFNVLSFNEGSILSVNLTNIQRSCGAQDRSHSLGLEKDEEIAKNLKKYKAEDQDVSMLLSEKDREKHRMLKNERNKWVNEWEQLNEVEIKEILDVSEE